MKRYCEPHKSRPQIEMLDGVAAESEIRPCLWKPCGRTTVLIKALDGLMCVLHNQACLHEDMQRVLGGTMFIKASPFVQSKQTAASDQV